jgi:hypothetical protein
MTRRIVLCLSHSIEEHDQLRLLHEIGHEVASIGGYIDPAHPHDPKRPALPNVPMVPVIKEAVDNIGSDDNLGAAQSLLPDAVLEWADTIIYHHYLDRLYGQWGRISDWLRGDPNRRVIWRTVGQSVDGNEFAAQPYRADGLEIVRYSPKERNIPNFAGEDALIRFYKDPEEWQGWNGSQPTVINITQHLRQRDPYTNWQFWEDATKGLNRMALGPGSEVLGGPGELEFFQMQHMLRTARVYLYTGTQPASYTLGLIEAMMTGIPVVSIGPSHMQIFPYGPDLFEGHEIVDGSMKWSDDPAVIRDLLQTWYLRDGGPEGIPQEDSIAGRQRAIDLFGIDTIREQWRAFLA